MSAPAATNGLPRAALLAIGAVLALSIVAAAIGRITGPVASTAPTGRMVMERDLRFADRADGGVDVIDARTGAEVALLAAGSNAFLRAMMRALAHQRAMHAGTPDIPFHLAAWDDGRLTLTDPSTGRAVGLEAFGPDNEIVFARLLTGGKKP